MFKSIISALSDFVFSEESHKNKVSISNSASKKSASKNTHSYNREDYAYPPARQGTPFVKPEDIVLNNTDLIDRIKMSAGERSDEFEVLYMTVINRFASFVHLLPASENQHHSLPGGLFRHCMEVGFISLMKADRTLYGIDKPPSQRQEIEKRWKLSAFIAGLAHDIGKPLSDMVIVNDMGDQWSPFLSDIYKWGKERNANYYTVSWVENRYKKHEVVSGFVLDTIAGADIKNFLYNGDPNILHMMMSAILTGDSESNMIAKIISEADHQSTKYDIDRVSKNNHKTTSMRRKLMDAISSLLYEKTITINIEHGKAFLIQDGLFLRWPSCSDLIIKYLEKTNQSDGVPKDSRSLADLLIDEGIALPGVGLFQSRLRVWRINVPDLLDANGEWCLRLSDYRSFEDPTVDIDFKPIDGGIWKDDTNKQIVSIVDSCTIDNIETKIDTSNNPSTSEDLDFDADLYDKSIDDFKSFGNTGFVLHSLLRDVATGLVKNSASDAIMLDVPKEMPVSWAYMQKSGFIPSELLQEMKDKKLINLFELTKPVHIIEGNKFIVFNNSVKEVFVNALNKIKINKSGNLPKEQKPILDIDYFIMTSNAISTEDASLPQIIEREDGKFIEIELWINWIQTKTNDSKNTIKRKLTSHVPTSYYVVLDDKHSYLRIA